MDAARRMTRVVLVTVLVAAALAASSGSAFAWARPSVEVDCAKAKVFVTLTDHDGDYANSDALVFKRPDASTFERQYTWTSGVNQAQTFWFPLTDFPNGPYEVWPKSDSAARRTFTVSCASPTPTPTATPSSSVSSSASPSPSPSPSGGLVPGRPGLPNTGRGGLSAAPLAGLLER